MDNEIILLKNNDNRTDSDLEKVQEFYKFLQGEVPNGIVVNETTTLNLTPETAFTIIWYLQEHLSVFPDNIEKCSICGELYDSYSEGYHSEKRDLFMCSSCDDGIDDDEVEESDEADSFLP